MTMESYERRCLREEAERDAAYDEAPEGQPAMMKTRAIGADELRAGHVLIGDSISPTHYGIGATVNAVNDDLDGRVLAIVDGDQVELLASETVYVAAV